MKKSIFSILNLIALMLIGKAVFSQEISQFPYKQDFEGNWNTEGWDVNNGDINWIQEDYPQGYQSDNFLEVTDLENGEDAWLYSPVFRMDNIESAKFSLKYWLNGDYSYSTSYSKPYVRIDIRVNQGPWTQLFYTTFETGLYWQGVTKQLSNYLPISYEPTIIEFRIFVQGLTHSYGDIRDVRLDWFEIKNVVYRDGYDPNEPNYTSDYGWYKIDTLGLILPNGKLALNSTQLDPNYEFWVNGSMKASEILIQVDSVPDYVFEPDYNLWSLEEIEQYIHFYKHLPGIPSQYEIKQQGGANMGELNMKLLQKIEELTLYTIRQQKEIEALKSKLR